MNSSRACLILMPFTALALVSIMASPEPLHTSAAEPKNGAPEFGKVGVAFLKKHCIACHGEKTQRANKRFDKFDTDESLLKDRKLWHEALQLVNAGEMPPKTKP